MYFQRHLVRKHRKLNRILIRCLRNFALAFLKNFKNVKHCHRIQTNKLKELPAKPCEDINRNPESILNKMYILIEVLRAFPSELLGHSYQNPERIQLGALSRFLLLSWKILGRNPKSIPTEILKGLKPDIQRNFERNLVRIHRKPKKIIIGIR